MEVAQLFITLMFSIILFLNCNFKILNLQLEKNLKDLLTELRGFKFVTTLALNNRKCGSYKTYSTFFELGSRNNY